MGPNPLAWLGCIVAWIARPLLALRYRVEIRGLETIRPGNRRGMIFLPNHSALVDPIIMMAWIYPRFRAKPLADEYQVNRTAFGRIVKIFGTHILPNMERRGANARTGMRQVIDELIEDLKAGSNILFYPSGRIKRQHREDVGSASGAEVISGAIPDLRVVLVRHDGLWGSSFSFAPTGRMPAFGPALLTGLGRLLQNGIFFMPRRHVVVEFLEPADFPHGESRAVINAYLERFYNQRNSPNTFVPYLFWQRGGPRVLPEPATESQSADATSVAAATQSLVIAHLAEISGREDLTLEHQLAADAGLDSLATAELVSWIQSEFGFSVGTPESLHTVGDVVLAAAGQGISAMSADVKPVASRWFAAHGDHTLLTMPEGRTLTDVFLAQAAARRTQPVVADQTSGVRTYQDLLTAIVVLKPVLEQLPGEYVGIMMPASVPSVVLILAAMFAGKTAVMVNYTTGARTIRHSLDTLGVRTVLTARALVTKLAGMGFDLSDIQDRFLMMEDVVASIGTRQKLLALVRSHVGRGALARVPQRDVAVVLFTSGSENLPKAVPLTHTNLLTNVRDILAMGQLEERDVMIGILPPFHSFGITATILTPLCIGMRAAYHTNPTEAAIVARQIQTYHASVLFSTPTFLAGIVRAAEPGQLDTLRLTVTGAEKCPEQLYDTLRDRVPHAIVLEGYGITECSPVVSCSPMDKPVPGSIGRLLPSVEGVVTSLDLSRRAQPDETGMLLVRGPSIFTGYLHYSGESPFVDFEGRSWYRTGDLVAATADGTLFFKGRLKRFVKLGGEMVSLPAIESVLLREFADEGVEGPLLAVEAIGNPDSPDIVLFARTAIDRLQANAVIRDAGMSALHNVRQVIHVDDIPVLGTGKTDYRTLKARYAP